MQNQIGDKFNRWTIIATALPLDKCRNTAFLCRCDCGAEKVVRQSHLRAKISGSCGCLNKENRLKAITKHSQSYSITYTSWAKMKTRCINPKNDNFFRYGGRGISVCERWLKFENFLADMGERPSKLFSIDRIDNNGNYEPKWYN